VNFAVKTAESRY